MESKCRYCGVLWYRFVFLSSKITRVEEESTFVNDGTDEPI